MQRFGGDVIAPKMGGRVVFFLFLRTLKKGRRRRDGKEATIGSTCCIDKQNKQQRSPLSAIPLLKYNKSLQDLWQKSLKNEVECSKEVLLKSWVFSL